LSSEFCYWYLPVYFRERTNSTQVCLIDKPCSDVSWVTFRGKKFKETLPPDLAPQTGPS
jgi:hypothetical protein